jgi:exonuclease I
VRDVLQRALFWFDEHPEAPKPANYKLATVAQAFGIPTDGAHDALADCRLAWQVAKAMREAL